MLLSAVARDNNIMIVNTISYKVFDRGNRGYYYTLRTVYCGYSNHS